MLTVAGGVLLAVLVLRIGFALIDWLDWRTSQITDDEAHRRARLALAGQWPPPESRAVWTPVAWTWAIIALLWMGWTYLRGMWR